MAEEEQSPADQQQDKQAADSAASAQEAAAESAGEANEESTTADQDTAVPKPADGEADTKNSTTDVQKQESAADEAEPTTGSSDPASKQETDNAQQPGSDIKQDGGNENLVDGDVKETEAAIKIQAMHRGRRDRKHVNDLKNKRVEGQHQSAAETEVRSEGENREFPSAIDAIIAARSSNSSRTSQEDAADHGGHNGNVDNLLEQLDSEKAMRQATESEMEQQNLELVKLRTQIQELEKRARTEANKRQDAEQRADKFESELRFHSNKDSNLIKAHDDEISKLRGDYAACEERARASEAAAQSAQSRCHTLELELIELKERGSQADVSLRDRVNESERAKQQLEDRLRAAVSDAARVRSAMQGFWQSRQSMSQALSSAVTEMAHRKRESDRLRAHVDSLNRRLDAFISSEGGRMNELAGIKQGVSEMTSVVNDRYEALERLEVQIQKEAEGAKMEVAAGNRMHDAFWAGMEQQSALEGRPAPGGVGAAGANANNWDWLGAGLMGGAAMDPMLGGGAPGMSDLGWGGGAMMPGGQWGMPMPVGAGPPMGMPGGQKLPPMHGQNFAVQQDINRPGVVAQGNNGNVPTPPRKKVELAPGRPRVGRGAGAGGGERKSLKEQREMEIKRRVAQRRSHH